MDLWIACTVTKFCQSPSQICGGWMQITLGLLACTMYCLYICEFSVFQFCLGHWQLKICLEATSLSHVLWCRIQLWVSTFDQLARGFEEGRMLVLVLWDSFQGYTRKNMDKNINKTLPSENRSREQLVDPGMISNLPLQGDILQCIFFTAHEGREGVFREWTLTPSGLQWSHQTRAPTTWASQVC